MKWLFLLCSLSYGFIMAQDCKSHALMQKGARLKYKEYWINSSRNIPIAQVLFTVDRVTDSAGSTWSSITKRVFSNIDSNDHYERNIVLQCDGKNLLFPYDLFFADTIYRRDFYPDVYSHKYNYSVAYTQLKDAITYIVPLAAGGFDCYKFCMELTDKGSEPVQCNLYYNKEAGFVKLEDYRRYVELINIRK